MIHRDAWGNQLHNGQLVSAPNAGHVRVWALGRALDGESIVLAVSGQDEMLRFLACDVVAVYTVPR